MKVENSIPTEPRGHELRPMLDLRDYENVNKVTGIERRENGIDVTWEKGGSSRFFYSWFRENCASTKSRNVFTLERRVDPLDIPFDITPKDIDLSDHGLLTFTWDDGHISRFPSGWLWYHSPDNDRNINPAYADHDPDWRLHQDAVIPRFTYNEYMKDDVKFLGALDNLLDKGVILIDDVPCWEDAVVVLANRISYLRETHYGPTFHVRYVPDPISGAFTNERLISHTDLPNFENPPGIQFFHCIRNDAEGGETVLVDGFAVAQRLHETAPHHFDALVNNALSFRLQDRDNDRHYRAPVIELDYMGRLKQIRYSRTNLTPYVGPADTYKEVREAYLAFTELVESPEFEMVFKLDPGELLVTENTRILHGRKGFDRACGDRHLQGCYIDRVDVVSRRDVTKRRLANDV